MYLIENAYNIYNITLFMTSLSILVTLSLAEI